MRDLGTLSWGVRTRGRLDLRERWQMVREGIALQLRSREKPEDGITEASLREIEAPRSAVIALAEEACAPVHAPWLTNHCLRTWAFGALLGLRDGLSFDREQLFLAALLQEASEIIARVAVVGGHSLTG